MNIRSLALAISTSLLFTFTPVNAEPTATKAETLKPINNIITLYESPDQTSASVGQVKPSLGLIPIFAEGNWIKVANPENGDVGWVNAETLKTKGLKIQQTKLRSFSTQNNTDEEVRTFQFSFPKLSDEQINRAVKSFDENRKELQENMKQFQEIVDQMMNQGSISIEALLRSFSERDKSTTQSKEDKAEEVQININESVQSNTNGTH